MKAIAYGSLASWVIKASHSAVPYSNEEEISLWLKYFLLGLYFYSLLRLWKMFPLLLIVSCNIFLNCESEKKKKSGKILHSVKLWKKCLESRWPWKWLSQCCTCPGCSLLSRWLVTLLPWCVPVPGARQVQTARCVENGCDGGGRNDAKKTVVVENWAEEPSLLGLKSSSTSYWWKDLGRFVSPPASVLWAVRWDDRTVCLPGLASGCRELRRCECTA